MKRSLALLAAVVMLVVCIAADEGPKINILKRITIPTVDISAQTDRHVIVAQGTEKDFQGHLHTLLMPDGKTIFCVWQGRRDGSGKHGAPVGYLKRSDDGGLTWSDYLDVPPNWLKIGRGCPTIHRLVDAEGKARLFVFCRNETRTTLLQAASEDGGKTWSPLRPVRPANPAYDPVVGKMGPITILEATGPAGSRKHLMWYEHPPIIHPFGRVPALTAGCLGASPNRLCPNPTPFCGSLP